MLRRWWLPRKTGALEAVGFSAGIRTIDDLVTNSDRSTAFFRSSGSGLLAIVKVFLKKNGHIDFRRTAKYTDLMVASMNGYADIVKLLLEKGANPTLTDNEGKTAIDYAGNPDIKNLLKRTGTPDNL